MSGDCSTSYEAERREFSKKALAAALLATLGLFLWLLGVIPAVILALLPARDMRLGLFVWIFAAVPAIVLALLAKREIRKNELLRGRSLANIALGLGIIEIIAPPVLVCAVMMHGPLAGKELVAHFHLSGALAESPERDPIGKFMSQPSTLYNLLKRIKEAEEDPAVKAAIITVSGLDIQLAETEELRAALLDFSSSGKKVLAHCEESPISLSIYTMLASASRLSVMPEAWLDLRGLYGESMFLKDALDKIGVQSDVLHVGDYKAAGEMLSRSEPSDAARENMNWLMDGFYQSCTNMLAESRRQPVDKIRRLLDDGLFIWPRALQAGLVDAVEDQNEFLEYVKHEYGKDVFIDNDYHKEPAPEVNSAHPVKSFLNVLAFFARHERPASSGRIALIYLDGTIVTGFGPSDAAHCGDIRAALNEAMEDDSIKAVVLRVNSPGGSAAASEVIYRAEKLLQAKKPLIVSMGDVAASGGYYVSCGAKAIFADETTVTGSIGVITSKLVYKDLWKKLGINWAEYQRGVNADLFSSQHPFTEPQRAVITDALEATYKEFKEHIETGRGQKLTKNIEDIAGGRIFTGKQALDLGLVDKIGGLEDAIAFAAQSVSIEKPDVRIVPEPKDAVTLLADAVLGETKKPNSDIDTNVSVRSNPLAAFAASSTEARGIAALLAGLDPAHADAVAELFCRIRLLDREGVAMLMPQVLVFH